MAPELSWQTFKQPAQRVKRSSLLSPRWANFLVGWFFGWPLLIYAYNPLAAPYDPLTLLIVIPGGAIWLCSCGLGCAALFAMAEARWPVVKTVRDLLGALLYLIMNILFP
jgi:bacteriorhodopsin